MKRRNALTTLAAGIPTLGGCLGTSGQESPQSATNTEPEESATATATATESPVPTPVALASGETYDDGSLSITAESPKIVTSLFYFDDDVGFVYAPDEWIVAVPVPIEAERKIRARTFTLQAGSRFEPTVELDGVSIVAFIAFETEPISLSGLSLDKDFWLLFTVPPRKPTAPTLEWDGSRRVRWAFDSGSMSRLENTPPAFTVHDFSVPDQVAPGEAVLVTFDVQNTTPTTGTFRAALTESPRPYPHRVVHHLSGGQRTEFTTELPGREQTETGEIKYHVLTGSMETRVSVEISE